MHKVLVTLMVKPGEYVTETVFTGTWEECQERSERYLEEGIQTTID